MNQKEINKVLKLHKKWLNGEKGGIRADLQGASLQGADLQDTYLQGADLRGADLRRADLQDSSLQGASLQGASLQGADLQGADLRGADLRRADLRDADLRDADLWSANLQDAKGLGAFIRCPKEGSIIGYKKADCVIIKLGIPKSAQRVNAISSMKCRCDKAKVLEILNSDGTKSDLTSVKSNHDKSFVYELEKIVQSEYDPSDRVECSKGIHFFMTFEEAKEY